jgi:hypothetical protein
MKKQPSLNRALVAQVEKQVEQDVEDEKDYDMDDWMAMSDAEQDRRLAESEREASRHYAEQEKQLSQLPRLKRYRYERRLALYYLLKWHAMHDRIKTLCPDFDFMHTKNRAIIKRRQAQLLDWRRFLVTGVLPRYSEQQ